MLAALERCDLGSEARLLSDEPSDAQVRWVLRLVWLVLALFAILVLVGNHVPSAELTGDASIDRVA